MRVSIYLLLCTTVAPASVAAQGAVPPLVDRSENPSSAFDPSFMIPPGIVNEVHQIHMVPRGSGRFIVALSVRGLSPAFGGAGGLDLLTGEYNALTDTFVADTHAAALNSPANEFGLMLEQSGRVAVFDRLGSLPELAQRPDLDSAWQGWGPIQGPPPQSYYDPALAEIGGQPVMLYVDTGAGEIVVAALMPLPGYSSVGPPHTIIRPTRSGAVANSPTPIVDGNGELIGVSHHEHVGQDNDHYCSFDLDPGTPAILMNDTTTWSNNGGFAGGRFFDAENSPSPYHVLEMDTFWFTGGRASIGSVMEISAYVTPGPSASPTYLSYLMASWHFITPRSEPRCRGLLGIDPNYMLAVEAMGFHDHRTGRVSMDIAVPPNPQLRGLVIPVQCLTLSSTGTCYLGNTAALTVE